MTGSINVAYQDLFEIGIRSLEIVGVPPDDAKTAVEVLLSADLRGIDTHGIRRLLMYVPRLRKGLINPNPTLVVETPAPALRIVQGDNGLGPVVGARGMKEAIDLAGRAGIAFVGCRDSNHFGAAAPYVLMACRREMIGIAGTNGFPSMAPWGGLERLVGNNPLAVGVPYKGGGPFVLDMAMSVSSRGRIREMAEKREKIPEGWALDSEGRPTTDPLEGLKGFVLPIGSHKGYGLALAMDVLSGVLTGAGFSAGVKSLLQQWEEPQHIGHFFVAIDPRRFMDWDVFSDRMDRLCNLIRSARRIDPRKPVLIPGEPEAQTERARRTNGIPLEPEVFENLKGLTEGRYDYDIPRF
ncbi:MAG: Ldh family oxidoreductase [Deltaproteobacteria bacterium]|nr:Ldh family oxidoreductase [Deltaproteobacteria bacterium]